MAKYFGIKIIEGGDEFGRTLALEVMMDGGLLLCGLVWSEIGANDPFVMKLNSCGEKEWCTIFASSNQTNPWAQDIKETQTGDIIVFVNQYGEDNVEDLDLFKLNSSGELIWKETFCSGAVYPEAALPSGESVFITSDQKYIISGSAYWEDPWNPGGIKTLRQTFTFVDSNGNEQWVLPFGLLDTLRGDAYNVVEITEKKFLGICSYWKNQNEIQPLYVLFDDLGNELDFKSFQPSVFNSGFVEGHFENAYIIDSLILCGGIFVTDYQESFPIAETKSDSSIFSN